MDGRSDADFEVTVAPATRMDAVRVTEMMLGFKQETQRVSPEHDALRDDAAVMLAEKVTAYVTEAGNAILLARDASDDEVVGFIACHVWTNLSIYRIEKMGYISELYVVPSRRRLGVGARLLEEAENYFQGLGLSHARIETITHYKANAAYYESRGYSPFLIELRKKLSKDQ